MRATCLVILATAFIGCGKIDSSRSTTGVDTSAPTVTRPDDAARPPATATNNASRPAAAPDNTAVNQRDTNRETREPKLPIDQKESRADVDLTAKIRNRVVNTDGLSVNARNAKIITADGKVTLRGPVESQAERDTIERIAREEAGDANVDDQLEVKSSSTSTPNP